jgi:O-antigen ligase
MRVVFGVLSLLVAVAIVGILAKKQLTSVSAPPAASGMPVVSGIAPAATPQQQVQQFRQAVQGTLQQARPMPEDK